jgi:hypothetical protein
VRDVYELLGLLARANEAAGKDDVFVLHYTHGGPEIIGHAGWPDHVEPPSNIEVDELVDQGWVRVMRSEGKARRFAVTGAGVSAWRERQAQLAPGERSAVDLSWPSARLVLQRLFAEYVAQGAPEPGLKTPALVEAADSPADTAAAIRELARNGYLEVAFGGQGDAPMIVRPTAKTFVLEGGWPATPAEEALNELVSALEREIDATSEPEKRSALERLRTALGGAARDFVIGYLASKAASG